MARTAAEVNRLFEENKGLYYACTKHCIQKYANVPHDEVMGIVDEAVTRALYAYDPAKGALSTIVYRAAENGICKYLVHANQQKRIPSALFASLNSPIADTNFTLGDALPVPTDIESEITSKVALETWMNKNLNERERRIVLWRHEGYSLEEIGEKLGVTGRRIGQIIRRINLKYKRAARDGSPEAAREK